MYLYLLLLFPLIWPVIAHLKWPHSYTRAEAVINIVVCAVLSVSVWHVGRYSLMEDTQILNGEVLAKERKRVRCTHSYEICSGSGEDKSCVKRYEHSHDYDWLVKSSVGDFKIARVNRRGDREPPRFSKVQISEPVALEDTYLNYVKAAKWSIFNRSAKDAREIPEYPEVYDYHRVYRVFVEKTNIPNRLAWNSLLAEELKVLGPQKQANVILFFVGDELGRDYPERVWNYWQGAKKNDIVIFIGMDNYPVAKWIEVRSWAKFDIFNVRLRDRLLTLKELQPGGFMQVLREVVMEDFERRPMKEFEYLKYEVEPPLLFQILVILISIPGTLLLSYVLYRNDLRA